MNLHYQYLMITVFLSIALFSISPMSHSADGEEDVMAQLNAIHVSLTDGDAIREKMIKGWLSNQFSGYPDLVSVLLRAIRCPSPGCAVKGPKLPLDVIEKQCRQNRRNANAVIMNHTVKEVRKAYRMIWHERNGHQKRELTIKQILSGQ